MLLIIYNTIFIYGYSMSCSLSCLHSNMFALQAECEILHAEVVKLDDNARCLLSTQDVSTLSLDVHSCTCLSYTLHYIGILL